MFFKPLGDIGMIPDNNWHVLFVQYEMKCGTMEMIVVEI